MHSYGLYQHAPAIREWNTIDVISKQFEWDWNKIRQLFVNIDYVEKKIIYRIDFSIDTLTFRPDPFSRQCAKKVKYNINHFMFL